MGRKRTIIESRRDYMRKYMYAYRHDPVTGPIEKEEARKRYLRKREALNGKEGD